MGIREVSDGVRAVDARWQMKPVPYAAALGIFNAAMWWFISHSWLVGVTTGLVWFVLWGWVRPWLDTGRSVP